MTIEDIAKACHEANRVYCEAMGDMSQVPWDEAPQWQRASVIDGVNAIAGGLVKKPSDSHTNWLAHKVADGWVYGEVKDAEKKTHPCMVPYEQLPRSQRIKDDIFWAITTGLLAGSKDLAYVAQE